METLDWGDDEYDSLILDVDEKVFQVEELDVKEEDVRVHSNYERLAIPASNLGAAGGEECISAVQSKWDVFRQESVRSANDSPVTLIKSMAQLRRERLEASESAKPKMTVDQTAMFILKKAVGFSNTAEDDDIVYSINVNWIKTKSSQLPLSTKVPLLFVAVQKNAEKENCITVMDASGSIIAGLNKGLCSTLKKKFIVGSCLALRKCSIMTHRKNTMITITEKNLICIASKAKFVDNDLTIPTWSDYVFFRKKDENDISVLQFATLDYCEIESETLAILDQLSMTAKSKATK